MHSATSSVVRYDTIIGIEYQFDRNKLFGLVKISARIYTCKLFNFVAYVQCTVECGRMKLIFIGSLRITIIIAQPVEINAPQFNSITV